MSHPQQPLVSIIVPTKNSHAFLRECLESIKQQTYPHIELIVVDNHSTDATQKIAREYTDKVFTQGPERSHTDSKKSVQTGGFDKKSHLKSG